MNPEKIQPVKARNTLLSSILFGSRWLQVPLYLGLIGAQLVYVVHFMVELEHLVVGTFTLSEEAIMLIVLGLIDVVMISNLLIMVIVGGYETFVSRLNLEGHPDEPEWLSHVNANVLKVKLATAIIGISSIHLLKTFINAPNLTDKVLMWQTIIHMAFIVSAVAIAYIDKLMPHPAKH
ncbi:MAG: TIGR00645 family protein [Thiobacillus sp.]|nr:TIGR00645 family protein [Thiobacillus sp.]